MSAPGDHLERQQRQHRVPLLGILASLAFAFVLYLIFFIWLGLGAESVDLNGDAPGDGQAATMTPGNG